jgi:hypothetical protein
LHSHPSISFSCQQLSSSHAQQPARRKQGQQPWRFPLRAPLSPMVGPLLQLLDAHCSFSLVQQQPFPWRPPLLLQRAGTPWPPAASPWPTHRKLAALRAPFRLGSRDIHGVDELPPCSQMGSPLSYTFSSKKPAPFPAPLFPAKQQPQRARRHPWPSPIPPWPPSSLSRAPRNSSNELLPCIVVGRRCYYLAPSSRNELHRRPAQQAARCSSTVLRLESSSSFATLLPMTSSPRPLYPPPKQQAPSSPRFPLCRLHATCSMYCAATLSLLAARQHAAPLFSPLAQQPRRLCTLLARCFVEPMDSTS